MYAWRRKRFTLMPAVTMAALGALIAIPALSQSHFYAASPTRMVTVTVARGESLWSIADRYTATDGSTQETIDRILAANHLRSAAIVPGERLRIPH